MLSHLQHVLGSSVQQVRNPRCGQRAVSIMDSGKALSTLRFSFISIRRGTEQCYSGYMRTQAPVVELQNWIIRSWYGQLFQTSFPNDLEVETGC